MKMVWIMHDVVLTDEMQDLLDELGIVGVSRWSRMVAARRSPICNWGRSSSPCGSRAPLGSRSGSSSARTRHTPASGMACHTVPSSPHPAT